MAKTKKPPSNRKVIGLFLGGFALAAAVTTLGEMYFDPHHEGGIGGVALFFSGIVLGGLSSIAASTFVAGVKNWKSKKRATNVGNEEPIVEDEVKASRVADTLLYFSTLGGLIGMATAVFKFVEYFRSKPKLGLLELFIGPAFAADGVKTELSSVIPYVAVGVLGLMGVSFLLALGTILLLPDTKENQARIKAADNIVKTFGGFFTGLATTLLK